MLEEKRRNDGLQGNRSEAPFYGKFILNFFFTSKTYIFNSELTIIELNKIFTQKGVLNMANEMFLLFSKVFILSIYY